MTITRKIIFQVYDPSTDEVRECTKWSPSDAAAAVARGLDDGDYTPVELAVRERGSTDNRWSQKYEEAEEAENAGT